MQELGRIVQKDKDSIQWIIHGFSCLPKVEDIEYCSPYIELPDCRLRWFLFPNGRKGSDLINYRLWRFPRPDKNFFSVSAEVGRVYGKEEAVMTEVCLIDQGYQYSRYSYFPFYIQVKEGEFLSPDALTITFTVLPRESLKYVSQETQTDDSNSEFERQNGPSQEEVSSSEAKDTIFQETQTDFLENTADTISQETQTEVLENTVDKEKEHENEKDCTCSEAKGVMILSNHMKELLVKGDDCDLRICVEDKEFPVHKVILKSRSPVFRAMLLKDHYAFCPLSIEECDADTFGEFLSYMYCGKTGDLTVNKAINLFYIAHKYSVPELKEQCVAFLKTSLSTSNICNVILLSTEHDEKDLLEFATNFFTQNIEEILVKEEWQNFLISHPTEANELYIKSLLHIKSSYKAL